MTFQIAHFRNNRGKEYVVLLLQDDNAEDYHDEGYEMKAHCFDGNLPEELPIGIPLAPPNR